MPLKVLVDSDEVFTSFWFVPHNEPANRKLLRLEEQTSITQVNKSKKQTVLSI